MRLLDKFTSVMRIKTREELFAEVVRFTAWLGFKTMNVVVVLDHADREPDFIQMNNTPPGAYSLNDPAYNRIDPVMQHCKYAASPIIWNQETYTSIGHGDRWDAQAQYGFHTGMALAHHLPAGRHFFIAVDRDQPLPTDPEEMTRQIACLHLFAAQAQDAAMSVLAPLVPQHDFPRLTPRELESLRWTMDGKTAWEVGCILGISEQTAVRHLTNAARKLDCVNKHHAVVRALRHGLIR